MQLNCSFYVPEPEIMRRTGITDAATFSEFLRALTRRHESGHERELSCFREHSAKGTQRTILWQCGRPVPKAPETRWIDFPARLPFTPKDQREMMEFLNQPDIQDALRRGMGELRWENVTVFHSVCDALAKCYPTMMETEGMLVGRVTRPLVVEKVRELLKFNVIHNPFSHTHPDWQDASDDDQEDEDAAEDEGQAGGGERSHRAKRTVSSTVKTFIQELPARFRIRRTCNHCGTPAVPVSITVKATNPENNRLTVLDEFRALSIYYTERRIPHIQHNPSCKAQRVHSVMNSTENSPVRLAGTVWLRAQSGQRH